jgi:hypothetical protein
MRTIRKTMKTYGIAPMRMKYIRSTFVVLENDRKIDKTAGKADGDKSKKQLALLSTAQSDECSGADQ